MKLTVHSLQFFVGFFATVSIGLFGGQEHVVEMVEAPIKPVAARARLLDPIESVSERNQKIEATYPELREALEKVSPLIAEEGLSKLDGYETAILPYLKEVSLKMLMDKFQVQDWEEWPQSALLPRDTSTEARNYIRDVGRYNPTLAAFLELSALFIHRAANAINDGRRYSLVNENISVDNYKAILEFADSNNVIGRITIDPSFLSAFERFECAFGTTYLTTSIDIESINYGILNDVTPYLCSEGALLQMEHFLTRLVAGQEKDKVYFLLGQEQFKTALEKFSASSQEIRARASLLYTFGASSALNDGDSETADYLYRIALEIDPTSKGHLSFANIFSRIEVPAQVQAAQTELLAEIKSDESGLGWTAVVAVLVALSVIIFAVRKI